MLARVSDIAYGGGIKFMRPTLTTSVPDLKNQEIPCLENSLALIF
jgi:hypothetical protein